MVYNNNMPNFAAQFLTTIRKNRRKNEENTDDTCSRDYHE